MSNTVRKKAAAPRKRTAVASPTAGAPVPPAVPVLPASTHVTSAQEWRARSTGMVIELPSGMTARVRRRMNLLSMLENGEIPNPLANLVRDMIRNKTKSLSIADGDDEVVSQLMELVNTQMVNLFVEPRVQMRPAGWDDSKGPWVPDEDAIEVDDIDIADRMYVFAFAQGSALDLAGFRQQQAALMAGTQHGAGVADATVGTAGG